MDALKLVVVAGIGYYLYSRYLVSRLSGTGAVPATSNPARGPVTTNDGRYIAVGEPTGARPPVRDVDYFHEQAAVMAPKGFAVDTQPDPDYAARFRPKVPDMTLIM